MMTTKKLTMSKKIIASAIALTLTSTSLQAQEVEAWQKGGIVTGGAVIGAIAGGPIGFLIGAGLGIWINDERDQAAKTPELEMTLTQKQTSLEQMHQELIIEKDFSEQLQLDSQNQHQELALMSKMLAEYQHLAMQTLQFDIKFRTAKSLLENTGHKKIQQLAQFIKRHPQIMVSLEGYADPRGSSEYNQELSNYRVQSVMNSLMEAGIDPERIQLSAFGASESEAKIGDLDGYAFDRRVSIELFEQGLALTEQL